MKGQRFEISTGFFLDSEMWVESTQQIKGKSEEAKIIKNRLDKVTSKIQDIYNQLESMGQYLSDDFIAADEQGKVYAVPAAISVKEGSVKTLEEFYPELKSLLPEEAFTGKLVRYIPVNNLTAGSEHGYQVKAFVFVSYTQSEPLTFEKVETKEALRLLLEEIWVKPTAENVSCFFNWIQQTAFYRLRYSNTQEAIEAVEKLYLL